MQSFVALRRILINLLTNAFKFTHEGSVTLLATVEFDHGGMPSSPEWFVNERNQVDRIHASHFYAYFYHQFRRGISPPEALIVAYRRYRSRYAYDPRLDFDRGYVLVALVHGLWMQLQRTLEATRCLVCDALYVGAPGISNMLRHSCPFCKHHATSGGMFVLTDRLHILFSQSCC